MMFYTSREFTPQGELKKETASYCCICCGWVTEFPVKFSTNADFLFKEIRKYNSAKRQTQRDVILKAVGTHAGFMARSRHPLPTLTEEERWKVLYFLKLFLLGQELEIELKE